MGTHQAFRAMINVVEQLITKENVTKTTWATLIMVSME